MSDETIDLSGGEETPRADPEGLSFISEEEVQEKLEAAKVSSGAEPFPENCAYDAYQFLEAFREGFALVPEGAKYLSHLARIARAVHNDKSDILDELSRAHARGRCRSREQIDFDEAAELEAAEE